MFKLLFLAFVCTVFTHDTNYAQKLLQICQTDEKCLFAAEFLINSNYVKQSNCSNTICLDLINTCNEICNEENINDCSECLFLMHSQCGSCLFGKRQTRTICNHVQCNMVYHDACTYNLCGCNVCPQYWYARCVAGNLNAIVRYNLQNHIAVPLCIY